MKQYVLCLLAATLFCSSCASIVSHTQWPVNITSAPVGSKVVITNRDGREVFSGTTPTTTMLRSGAGFFRSEMYTLTFSSPGYDTKTMTVGSSVNGWYFGNLVFGGVIGLLIVDPATGAMFRLDQKEVQVALNQGQTLNLPEPKPNELQIVSLDNIPTELRYKLVPIK